MYKFYKFFMSNISIRKTFWTPRRSCSASKTF